MINLEMAKTKVKNYLHITDDEIGSITDVGHSWVFSLCDAETKAVLDEVPFAVDKRKGKISDYFPPEHAEEMSSAKIIYNRISK